MESQVSPLLQQELLITDDHRVFFFSSFLFIVFVLSVFLHFTKQRVYCNCDVCSAYLSSSWSREFNNLCDWYTHLLQKSPTQTITIHVLNNTITANPRNVEHILKTRFENYPKGKPFSAILGDLLGKGIFNVDGDSWLLQKKVASLELASISIRTYAFDIVQNEIESRLFPLLYSSGASKNSRRSLDLQQVFRKFSFDNICKFSFGLDPRCLASSMPISLFANSFDLASKLSAERATTALPLVWKLKRLLNIGTERELKKAIKIVNVLAMEVILQKRKLGFSTNQDLLSRFMNCINDDNHLRDIVISFILAGRDTMASALTTIFFLLAHRPEVVSKIRAESDKAAMAGHGQELASYDQIKEMHYLHASVYECLRLYPPVQFDSKFAEEDDFLADGTFVRKGRRVTYHSYAMGRMETIWGSDFMEFKPERWLKKNGTFCPQSPYRYPVFQAGARVCLGKELAVVEMKMVAVSVLSRFDVRVVEPKGAPRFDSGLTAMVRGGVHVVVEQREIGPQ